MFFKHGRHTKAKKHHLMLINMLRIEAKAYGFNITNHQKTVSENKIYIFENIYQFILYRFTMCDNVRCRFPGSKLNLIHFYDLVRHLQVGFTNLLWDFHIFTDKRRFLVY